MQKIIILLFLTLLISCSEEKQPEQSKTAAQPSSVSSSLSSQATKPAEGGVNNETPPKPKTKGLLQECNSKYVPQSEDWRNCVHATIPDAKFRDR